MRKYNSATDYHIILEAARKEGICIAAIARALEGAGIIWPALQDSYGKTTPEQDEMDKEIGRAWKELWYTK